jgi:hypothetical protein
MDDTARRQFPRFAIEAEITVRAEVELAHGRTRNLSRGGLCAVVDRAVRPGSLVVLDLTLIFDEGTFSEPLSVPARVVWCTELADHVQLGCMLLPLQPDQQSYLDMFLRYIEGGQEQDAPDAPDDPFD